MRLKLALVLLSILALRADGFARLPESFTGWQGKAVQAISAAELAAVAGEDASLIQEFGFADGERREYTKQSTTLRATIWHMVDATGSFGLFDFYRKPGLAPVKAEDRVASGADFALLQRGAYLLVVEGAQVAVEDLLALSAGIPTARGRESLLPSLPAYLPEKDLIAGTQRFFIGPVGFGRVEDTVPASSINFDMGAEAIAAKYRLGGSQARLLLVSYPTPQLAAKMLRSFEALPAFKSGENGRSIVRRKGNLIAFVLDAPNARSAQKLLDEVKYEMSFVWNEYVPSEKDNVGSMMLPIFSLAGFILLFAFVCGLAFGGVRVLAKRFIPIPIFDRPEQVEIIQLHINK